ncbi:MAG: hypothetical protein RR366_09470 [Clostridium sp.]
MSITFDNIGNGELAGMFRLALAQIGKNIMDPNMTPEEARGMTVSIKFKPKKGGTIDVSYDIKTKMAGMQKSETTFLIGQDARTGRIELSEYGNNRAQVQSCDTVSAVTPDPVTRDFNPDTGEIHQSHAAPINLQSTRT